MLNHHNHTHILELFGYLVVVSLFLLFNLYLAVKISYVQVDLVLETVKPAKFQVYWRQDKSPYEEKNSVVIKTHPKHSNYFFKITSFANFDRLRIDPADDKHRVHIKKLVLHHNLYKSVTIFPRDDEMIFSSSHQLQSVKQSKEDGLYIISAGTDPNFEISVDSSLDIQILYTFIALTIGGAILLYLLMNQMLLKGRRHFTTILMIIPQKDNCTLNKENLLQIVRTYSTRGRLISIQSQPMSKKYIFELPALHNDALIHLLKEVKKLSHSIQCRVHYNRSCEV